MQRRNYHSEICRNSVWQTGLFTVQTPSSFGSFVACRGSCSGRCCCRRRLEMRQQRGNEGQMHSCVFICPLNCCHPPRDVAIFCHVNRIRRGWRCQKCAVLYIQLKCGFEECIYINRYSSRESGPASVSQTRLTVRLDSEWWSHERWDQNVQKIKENAFK